ncbi:MAG: hypothetical protein JRG81_07555 [Deltaproteobacteria bacterium]|nr:hypothetical protein [Deltaproteobacteria bacterium]
MDFEYSEEEKQFRQTLDDFFEKEKDLAEGTKKEWNSSMGLQAGKEISMAKARSSDASRRICLLGVKVHGGIGIIDEYDMQLYFRRGKAMELAFGDGDFHREIVAAELGL